MAKDDKQIIDMTLEGEFIAPPEPAKPPLGAQIMLWAVVVIVVAAAVLVVALTFWFLAMILPVLLIAGLVAYLALRYQIWRHGGSFTIRRGQGGWSGWR